MINNFRLKTIGILRALKSCKTNQLLIIAITYRYERSIFTNSSQQI